LRGKKLKGEVRPVLSAEKVREFKGFENLSDEEIKNIIVTLEMFATIAFNQYIKLKNKDNHYE
jgi:hypothetical protein